MRTSAKTTNDIREVICSSCLPSRIAADYQRGGDRLRNWTQNILRGERNLLDVGTLMVAGRENARTALVYAAVCEESPEVTQCWRSCHAIDVSNGVYHAHYLNLILQPLDVLALCTGGIVLPSPCARSDQLRDLCRPGLDPLSGGQRTYCCRCPSSASQAWKHFIA